MFTINDILYEDNHLLVVNKHAGDLVQSDPDGTEAIEDQIKAMIKIRDHKPGAVFLGVVHRIDRPVSGAVVFAKGLGTPQRDDTHGSYQEELLGNNGEPPQRRGGLVAPLDCA